MWVTSSTDKVLTPSAIALGNFDGIHRGHQKVLQPILQASAVIGCPASARKVIRDSQCPYATVVTFNPHPQEFFTGQSKQLLTPLPEKVKLLEQLGVEQLVLLPFDRELAALSPQQFVEEILMRQLQATRISVGEDFRFGHKRAGTAEDLRAIAAKFGVEVVITSLQTCQGNESEQPTLRISSSAIRQALAEGDIDRANRMLGRAYTLMGTVVKGQQLGKTIGFPTANLQLPPTKLLPRYGVYCVKVFLEGEGENIITQSSIKGVMNIGCRPTVAGNTPTVEVHLLDWAGNLYGKTLTASLEKFLRPEQKFPSIDALKAQIAFDCDLARKILERST
ncbi:riboflavin biosynthesis protein RibF [Hydrococcus rivularis NIES-593]|uniref:Riboflavin biosynthesis protein n=1 Tax=Hydrococcus rivularis NIES-593 TaxID=1921803 RepID=A0A1U7HFL6_9CYAN|nr:bifunctional riboflavin kinase/FAD synthetase [Hydrococcus rivularis]OKH22341.1 riboflavin biosynthesis protein RibF [Hydrococcus rivularis NIES-593]